MPLIETPPVYVHGDPPPGGDTLATMAHKAAALLKHETGLTPAAAAVIGSRLYGYATPNSDWDILVLVGEKLPAPRHYTYYVGSDLIEVQAVPLLTYERRLAGSVPYITALRSPWLVSNPAWAPYLRALRVDEYILDVHRRGFAHHLIGRKNKDPEKKAKQLAAVAWLALTGEPRAPGWWFWQPNRKGSRVEDAALKPSHALRHYFP